MTNQDLNNLEYTADIQWRMMNSHAGPTISNHDMNQPATKNHRRVDNCNTWLVMLDNPSCNARRVI